MFNLMKKSKWKIQYLRIRGCKLPGRQQNHASTKADTSDSSRSYCYIGTIISNYSSCPSESCNRNYFKANNCTWSTTRGIKWIAIDKSCRSRGIAFPTNACMPASNSDEKNMPYCLIEFDKNQIMVGAKEVSSTANTGSSIQWKHRAHL